GYPGRESRGAAPFLLKSSEICIPCCSVVTTTSRPEREERPRVRSATLYEAPPRRHRARGRAAACNRASQLSVLRSGSAGNQRREVRPPVPRAAGVGATLSVAGDTRFAQPAGGRQGRKRFGCG